MELRIRKDAVNNIWYVQKKAWDYKTEWLIVKSFTKLADAEAYIKGEHK